jgi:8-amino-7-oxononanoate synthase
MRLSNAVAYKFAHNDIEALTAAVKRHRDKSLEAEVFIATESVFSMDGDSPNLTAMAALCAEYNCRLVVDEAHALGVFGNKGEGMVQHLGLQDKVFARIVTFGKGLGCHGAAVLGSAGLKRYLVNYARSFIYTTGLPPHSLATILTAYNYLEHSAEERNNLKYVVSFFKAEVSRLNLESFINSTSAIHCMVVPGNENVKNISSVLQQQGFGVKAILSPTVPAGQERLRFCLHSFNTPAQITQMLELLTQALPSS